MRNAECGVQSDVSRGGYGLTLAEIDPMWKTAPQACRCARNMFSSPAKGLN